MRIFDFTIDNLLSCFKYVSGLSCPCPWSQLKLVAGSEFIGMSNMEVYYFKYLLVFLSFRKGLGNAVLYENTSEIFAHQANTQYGAYILGGGHYY